MALLKQTQLNKLNNFSCIQFNECTFSRFTFSAIRVKIDATRFCDVFFCDWRVQKKKIAFYARQSVLISFAILPSNFNRTENRCSSLCTYMKIDRIEIEMKKVRKFNYIFRCAVRLPGAAGPFYTQCANFPQEKIKWKKWCLCTFKRCELIW